MTRRTAFYLVACFAVLIALAAFLAVQNVRQRTRIAELEHDSEVTSRLCGVVMCVPCNKGETGPKCQARMGDAYEVIYYPDAQAYIAELRSVPQP